MCVYLVCGVQEPSDEPFSTSSTSHNSCHLERERDAEYVYIGLCVLIHTKEWYQNTVTMCIPQWPSQCVAVGNPSPLSARRGG